MSMYIPCRPHSIRFRISSGLSRCRLRRWRRCRKPPPWGADMAKLQSSDSPACCVSPDGMNHICHKFNRYMIYPTTIM